MLLAVAVVKSNSCPATGGMSRPADVLLLFSPNQLFEFLSGHLQEALSALCLSALWPRDQIFSVATESKPFIELIQIGDGEERDESNALVLLNERKDARFFKRIIDLSILLLVRHSRTCLLPSLLPVSATFQSAMC